MTRHFTPNDPRFQDTAFAGSGAEKNSFAQKFFFQRLFSSFFRRFEARFKWFSLATILFVFFVAFSFGTIFGCAFAPQFRKLFLFDSAADSMNLPATAAPRMVGEMPPLAPQEGAGIIGGDRSSLRSVRRAAA